MTPSTRTFALSLAFLLLGSAAARADETPMVSASASGSTVPVNLDIHAEIRHRWEIDGRAKFNEDASTTEFSLLRSRLSVGAQLPKKVSIFLEAQDARVWGEEASTTEGSSPRGDMHQGYFLAEDLFAPGVWAKVGRTELSVANERLLGAGEWSNTGRAFDAIVLGYKRPSYSVQFFESKLSEGVGNTSRGKDYDFFGVFADVKAAPTHDVTAFLFYDHDKDTLSTGEDLVKRLTLGVNAHGSQSSIQYEADIAFQTGDVGASSLSASLFGGRLGYKIAHPYEPAIWVGLDVLSGDDDATDDEDKRFNTLFATNHKFYGAMDFFLDIPKDTKGAGLTDFLIKGSIKPMSWLTTSLAYHNFKASEDLVMNAGTSAEETLSSFGNEIDLNAKIDCTENVAVQSGFGFFSPGEIFEATRGDGSAYWGYLQTSVSY
ncbi:MAG: alginate export family protein [bacterium]